MQPSTDRSPRQISNNTPVSNYTFFRLLNSQEQSSFLSLFSFPFFFRSSFTALTRDSLLFLHSYCPCPCAITYHFKSHLAMSYLLKWKMKNIKKKYKVKYFFFIRFKWISSSLVTPLFTSSIHRTDNGSIFFLTHSLAFFRRQSTHYTWSLFYLLYTWRPGLRYHSMTQFL